MGTACLLTSVARANLALAHNPNATISSLSAQLLDHPRSAAGNRKNVWDCDPPDPALSGVHYFLYNYDSNGTPLPPGSQTLTFRGASPGPGYQFAPLPSDPQVADSPVVPGIEVLVRASGQQTPFYIQVGASTSYNDPDVAFNLPANVIELGVVRFAFAIQNADTVGDIVGSDDSPELDYDGPPDGLGGKLRGVEHLRAFTQTLPGHDDDVIRGTFTTLVPPNFAPGFSFPPGYLGYGNSDLSIGNGVSPASVRALPQAAPEPSVLGAMGMAALLLVRRSRR